MLFHKVFGGEPDGRLLSILASQDTADVFDEYAEESDTLSKLKVFSLGLGHKLDDAEFLDCVRDEYARFFQGPGNLVALPWESVYKGDETMVFQRSTLEVREQYGRWGLRVKRFKSMPDDHVSLMCAFMATLSARTLAAFRKGDEKAMRELLDAQRFFIGAHMSSWLADYAQRALRVKKAYLYPQYAQGVADFVAIDAVFADRALCWVDDQVDGSIGEWDGSCFEGVERSLADLSSLALRGIEDNELVSFEG